MSLQPAREQPGTGVEPFYTTKLGRAFLGDARDRLAGLASSKIDLVITSPPFPLTFRKKKPYTSVGEEGFVDWLLPYAAECHRVLKDSGSLVLDLGGVWNKGAPVRSLYQYKVVIALCEQLGFHLAQDFYWYNPGALPAPAEWVNVRRIRVKSAVNQVFWLGKTEWPKSDNRQVLRPYSRDMLRLIARGYRPKQRPSGHTITEKFRKNHGGAIPPNLLEFGNNDSNSQYLKGCAMTNLPAHPARFPRALPEFFVKLCTDPADTVLDPFAGSNVVGEVAERLGRQWVAIELVEDYLAGSRFRFPTQLPTPLVPTSSQQRA